MLRQVPSGKGQKGKIVYNNNLLSIKNGWKGKGIRKEKSFETEREREKLRSECTWGRFSENPVPTKWQCKPFSYSQLDRKRPLRVIGWGQEENVRKGSGEGQLDLGL